MKKNNLCLLGALLILGGACGKQDHYTLRGAFPGLEDGMVVTLHNMEAPKNDENRGLLARDTVRGGRFELRGSMEAPAFCILSVTNRPLVVEVQEVKDENGNVEKKEVKKGEVRTQKAWVMLDNSDLRLDVPHFDSIGYVSMQLPFASERTGVVKGSRVQEELDAYRRALLPVELDAYRPEDSLSSVRFWKYKYEPAEYIRIYGELFPQVQAGKAAVRKAREAFVAGHPQSAVAALAVAQIVDGAGDFALSVEELDALAASVKGVTDTTRMARLSRQLERARHLARGVQFADLPVVTLDGGATAFASYVKPGTYTLVDFWASWCGPCRAALPRVKELFREYDGRLAVLSVSCDEKADAWKQAVREEQLTEWPQLRLRGQEAFRELARHYNVTGIPSLVIIDPEGRIVHKTFDPQEIALVLKDLL